MDRKKRMAAASFAAIVFIIPMVFEMPDRTLGFFIFVFPLASFSFFMVLTLATLKDGIYKKLTFIIVALVCFIQFYWTYAGSSYPLLKALSYSLIGMGIAATAMLVLKYLLAMYAVEDDED